MNKNKRNKTLDIMMLDIFERKYRFGFDEEKLYVFEKNITEKSKPILEIDITKEEYDKMFAEYVRR